MHKHRWHIVDMYVFDPKVLRGISKREARITMLLLPLLDVAVYPADGSYSAPSYSVLLPPLSLSVVFICGSFVEVTSYSSFDGGRFVLLSSPF